MTPSADLMERLEAADPIAYLRDEAPVDEPAPDAVLDRILATPPARAPRPARRVGLAATAVAAVAIATVLALLPTGDKASLAARAYAWSPPATDDDALLYTQTTSETRFRPADGERAVPGQRIVVHIWQRGDRMHELEQSVQVDAQGRPVPASAPGRQRESLEHDQNGDVRRTLSDGRVQVIRADDPGWKGQGRATFADNLRPIVDKFRAAYEHKQLRDAGATTFAGRPAHAFVADGVTFYIDPDTAQPFATVVEMPTLSPRGEMTQTVVIDSVKRLPATPQNLAKLDAPAIDAAAAKAGR